MKRITLAILALTLAFPAVYAQEKPGNEMNKGPMTYRQHPGKRGVQHDRFKNLNLTKEQKDKLAGINKDYRSGINDLKRKEATITVKDYKTQMQALNAKRRAETDNVFTAEQKAQLQQMRQKHQGRPGMRGKAMSDLGLSENQSAQIRALRTSSREKVKTIRENQQLTDTQKKEQVIAVYKQQHEDMKSILTPEQMKKMEGFRYGRMHKISK
ncbi:MAG: hypothetical protein M9933_05655 [Chitinophagaceae bacterium]|nr:hypothetical protein [Chitinophagaceae bacterium]